MTINISTSDDFKWFLISPPIGGEGGHWDAYELGYNETDTHEERVKYAKRIISKFDLDISACEIVTDDAYEHLCVAEALNINTDPHDIAIVLHEDYVSAFEGALHVWWPRGDSKTSAGETA